MKKIAESEARLKEITWQLVKLPMEYCGFYRIIPWLSLPVQLLFVLPEILAF